MLKVLVFSVFSVLKVWCFRWVLWVWKSNKSWICVSVMFSPALPKICSFTGAPSFSACMATLQWVDFPASWTQWFLHPATHTSPASNSSVPSKTFSIIPFLFLSIISHAPNSTCHFGLSFFDVCGEKSFNFTRLLKALDIEVNCPCSPETSTSVGEPSTLCSSSYNNPMAWLQDLGPLSASAPWTAQGCALCVCVAAADSALAKLSIR